MDYFQQIFDYFTTQKISPKAKNAFYHWLIDEEHRAQKELRLKSIWDNSSSMESLHTQKSLQQVKVSVGISPKRGVKFLRFWQTVAAVLLIGVLGIGYLYLENNKKSLPNLIELYVPTAEMSFVTLPDGSQVQLNAHSILLYPESFSSKNRSVYLTGQANFKVKPDTRKPFIVKSSDFQITVLGTEFNVSAYPEDSVVKATLLSGSLLVEFNELKKRRVLAPNQQLAYNKYTKHGKLNTPNIEAETGWQRGELVFTGINLKEIITILERKYPYSFLYNSSTFKTDKYTFKFRENANLEDVMDIIVQVAGNIRYKIENNTCVITAI